MTSPFPTFQTPRHATSAPCAVLSPCPAMPAPWYGMRILLSTLATNELVWRETPPTLRPLLSGLFQKWCDYLTLQSSRQIAVRGASLSPALTSVLNTVADTVAGLTSDTGLTLVIPDLRSVDAETIGLLEPLLSKLGSKLRLVLGCDLAGSNRGIGEQTARRILLSIHKVPGAFVTFTAEPGTGRRLWINAQPDDVVALTESYELEFAA